MNINDIKKLIESDEYNFLRTNEHLNDRIIFLTLGGSYAYGTNVEGSDVDIRGVALERENEIIGLSSFDLFENKATDTVIYSFMKIISLLMSCNPNTIELLGVNPEHILKISKEGKLLLDNVDMFLSQKAVNSFGGYANQQLRRLQNSLARNEYSHSEKEKHLNDKINQMIVLFNERYENFNNDSIKVYIDESNKEEYDTEMFMDINLQHYPLRDFKNIYSEMNETVKQFGKLNNRNKKKSIEHLNKHAMHLVRLLKMGTEILSTGEINTYRENDKELLLDIRNGLFSTDEIFTLVSKLEDQFKYAKENTILPKSPNFDLIEEFVMQINREALKR